MTSNIFNISQLTTNAAPTITLYPQILGNGRSMIVSVNFIAIAANGKRITGNPRRMFSAAGGTATAVGAQVDAYLQKDAAGFADTALAISVATNTISLVLTQPNTVGDTYWDIQVETFLA